ncbi:hypothetical protein ACFX12_027213 [Malus domestica]
MRERRRRRAWASRGCPGEGWFLGFGHGLADVAEVLCTYGSPIAFGLRAILGNPSRYKIVQHAATVDARNDASDEKS